jgi:hypothetical protein
MKSSIALTLAILLILSSCASNHHETSEKMRGYVSANKYQKALELLKKSDLAKDENSRLLYLLEVGLLEHYQAHYNESIEALSSAQDLIEVFYTARVSNKLKTVITNDSADVYAGEKYEASLIYFYLTLNYYMKAQSEVDPVQKRLSLEKARAQVLAWDSFLTEIKNERLGQALFKEDLLAKTFGALVHESQGNSQDDQIALQLYKDASDVFFKNYNLFPTFNDSYKSFRDNFAIFPQMDLNQVAGQYVLETPHNQAFKNFLNMKLITLTNKLKGLKTPNANITFLVQDGLIVDKVAREYSIPLDLSTLGGVSYSFGLGNFVSFQLPEVTPAPVLDRGTLEAVNDLGQVVGTSPLSVIAPLGELAEQAINEHSKAIAAKTGARVLGKYVAALLTANAIYASGSRGKNAGLALMLATIEYNSAIVAINLSEKADLRFWSTLPSNIRMGMLNLPIGHYQFRVVYGEVDTGRVVNLGDQMLTKDHLKFVMNNHEHKSVQRGIANVSEPIMVSPETSDR